MSDTVNATIVPYPVPDVHSRAEALRHRESATVAMVRAIDAKLERLNAARAERLTAARAERLTALSKVQAELAQVRGTTPAAFDQNDFQS